MTVRTRMAPSPTGEYHMGSLRTYLYSYAYARKHSGQFILRIEDTDKSREVPGAADRLKEVLHDYGVGDWNEFYMQSERLQIYREHAEILVTKGHAYYCFCTSDRLDELRAQQRAQKLPKTFYDKKCRHLPLAEAQARVDGGEAYVIRQKVPESQEIIFNDAVLGEIKFDSAEVEDGVLLKSDGFPTYHLAVVVDDHLMGITHVMRGMEWIPSAPKHVLLYKSLEWEMPIHVHLPLLKEKGSNEKMSKRFGDVHAVAFLEKGYLPEAVLNFLMFLGWHPGSDEKQIYSLDEFIKEFSVERIHKTDLVAFDRDKLLWYNGYYIRNLDDSELYARLMSWATKHNVSLKGSEYPTDYALKVIGLIKERMKLLSEFNDLSSYFFEEPVIDVEALQSYAKDQTAIILNDLINLYENVSEEEWEVSSLDRGSHDLLSDKGYKPKETFMTLRIAVSGVIATPQIFDTIALIGKRLTISRLQHALSLLN